MSRYLKWPHCLVAVFVAVSGFWIFSGELTAQQPVAVPALQARVTDLAGLLGARQAQQLEQKLAALETRKGAQVAILIVPTTGAETIEQFGLRVAETWQLGRGKVDGQAVDDGLLLLIASKDRKIRLEVGYGLEGAVPDAYAKRIIADQISPAFRQGDFAGGLNAAVDSITALIDGEPLPAPQSKRGNQDNGSNYLGAIAVGFVVGMIAMAIVGRTLGTLAGIGAGVGTAFLMTAILSDLFFAGFGTWIVLSMFGGGRRMRRVGRHTYRSDGPVIFPGGFGGGGGGSGGFGGGFGGGGGGFGGGGASGGW
ncbi:MAG: TPM domain-containing protein [Burkholderiaceae bacterium]